MGERPTAEQIRAALLEQTIRGIEGMESRYRMYATHPQALEFRLLDAVALRQSLWGYVDFDIHAVWCSFIEQINGGPYPCPLYCLLRDEGRLAEHPKLLGDFARWVAREWPPEASGS